MTTATGMTTRQPDDERHECRSDISTSLPGPSLGQSRTTATRGGTVGETTVGLGASGRSHVQPPLLAVVRAGTCNARGCDGSSQHHDGGRLGYCQAHRARLRKRGCLDEHIPLRRTVRATPDVPLSDDVDEVAVDRVLTGQRTRLTPAEMRYVVALMSNRDLSAAHIADVLGVCERTVVRHRARIRAAS